MATQSGTLPAAPASAPIDSVLAAADAAAATDPAAEEAKLKETAAAIAEMAARAQRPGELKWRLTMILYPSILLIFVALYVSSLAAGTAVEMALLQSGGASLVLAVLARVAVGIIADETRLVLNDSQIIAMARANAIREHYAKAGLDLPVPAATLPSTVATAASTGGKE
ncbi:MAG: hypothetical protein AB7P40_26565 [Chloroflexota bacterium]